MTRYSSKSDAGAIKIRLDSDPIKRKLEVYLRGLRKIIVQDPETGEWKDEYDKVGKEKVNDVGLQAIMSFVETKVNSQTVQGNMERQEYKQFLAKTHMSLSRDLWINMHKYDIDEDEYDGIVENVMALIELFLSRTIDNLERKSYGESMKIEGREETKQRTEGGISFGL
jgi:hypothetical protein